MAYCTQEEVEAYLDRDLTAAEEALFPTVSEAASNWIDSQLGFSYASDYCDRIYDGAGSDMLFIEPLSTVDTVELLNDDGTVSYTYTPGTDYVALPGNDRVINTIVLRGTLWPTGYQNIRVTGEWGDEDVPADIRLATILLVSDWTGSSEALQSESIEGYSRTFAQGASRNPQVKQIIESRKRVLL